MALVADHVEHGRIDATRVAAQLWESQLHRRGAPLCCPQCRARMVAAVSSTGLWFFRHHRRPDRCDLHSESALHQQLKREVLAAVRAVAGWAAEPEVPGPGWRADVLATGPGGRRIAWEVQVSAIGADTARERTARLNAAGVEVCWLATADRPGLRRLPRALLHPDPAGSTITGHAEAFTGNQWEHARVPAAAFVAGVCAGSVFWVGTRPLASTGAWTTHRHVATAAAAAAARAQELAEQCARSLDAVIAGRIAANATRTRPGGRISIYPDYGDPRARVRRLRASQEHRRRVGDLAGDPPS